MRKKLISCFAVGLVLTIMAVILCSCGLFGGSSGLGGSKEMATTITLDVDGTTKTYSATYDTIVDLGLLTKTGYVFENATDENGQIYFNELGQSLTRWQNDYPTSFKANFKPVSGFTYSYITTWEDDPEEVYHMYGPETLDYGCENIVRRQLKSAILGNPYADIELKVFFREKNYRSDMRGEFVFKILELVNESAIYSMQEAVTNTSYKEYIEICSTKAYVISKGFRLSFGDTSYQILGEYRSVKDVDVTITFK